MKYEYPIITNIDDVLPAIKDREEFIVADRPGHKVINYLINFIDTFPKVIGDDVSEEDKKLAAMRRECRGIKFDDKGFIICRPLHKFFNLNEKEETQSNMVDVKEDHVILEKLDGSFIAPYVANNKLIYGTKMGETHITAQVLDFIEDKQKYNEFSLHLIDAGYTPIFEFTSPINRIVIPYSQTNLTLLAVRHMVSGRYYSYDEMKEQARKYDIPVVKMLAGSIENMQEFVEHTNNLVNEEGYVIRFASGYMLKLKSSDYVRKHKTKDSIALEKNILEIIFSEKLDDVIADLPEEDAAKVKKYAEVVSHSALTLCSRLKDIVSEAKTSLDNEKKRFAIEVVPNHRQFSSLLFSIWDGKDAMDSIKKHVLSNCGTQTKVDGLRHIIGPTVWRDIYVSNIED
jgi:RNA ligase